MDEETRGQGDLPLIRVIGEISGCKLVVANSWLQYS